MILYEDVVGLYKYDCEVGTNEENNCVKLFAFAKKIYNRIRNKLIELTD